MGKYSKLVEFWTRKLFQICACMISAPKAKHLDATTMFTYSHANIPLGQSERTYYLSYFIKCYTVVYISHWLLNLLMPQVIWLWRDVDSKGWVHCKVIQNRKFVCWSVDSCASFSNFSFCGFYFPRCHPLQPGQFFFQHHLAGVLKMLTVLKSLWLNLFCCLKNHKFNIVYFQALFLLWCDVQACHVMKTSQFGLNIIQYPVCNILIRSCCFSKSS